MKVTIVQGAFFPVPAIMGGAVEKVWSSLGGEFSRRGHIVTHVSRRHKSLANYEYINGVRHIRIAGFNAPNAQILHKLLDLVYTLRSLPRLPSADILVTNTFWLPLLVAGNRSGRVYVHVARHPKGQMFLYAKAARLQTVAHSVAAAIAREAPHLEPKVRVIPYPVTSECSARAFIHRDLRNARTILYVGRIHPEKGLGILIKAFRMLSFVNAMDWRLTLVGSADPKFGGGGASYLRHLQEMAIDVAHRIDWIGPVFDPKLLSTLYNKASLFVYPSIAERGETFGLAPLEAMSTGCPTIVSDLHCFREYLEDGVNGHVFNHRRDDAAGALREKMEACLSNLSRLEQSAHRGWVTASSYSIERIASEYLDDFASIIKGP